MVAGYLPKSTLAALFAVILLISITSGVTAWEAGIVPSLTKAVALVDQLLLIKSIKRETSSITIPPLLLVYWYIFDILPKHIL